ncbi:MAG: M23 family metallopeptidase [Litorimonas sp.]
MRAWLAISAIALTACAAEPEAEALPTLRADIETKVQEQGVRDEIIDVSQHRTPSDEIETALKLTQVEAQADPTLVMSSSAIFSDEPVLTGIEKFLAANSETTKVLSCHGIVKQGGLVVCQTEPNARVEVGRSENDTYTQTANKNGVLLVGFDRDEPAAFVRIGEARVDFDITPREYDTSRIDGLPKNMVSEYTPEELARIRKASALKKVGFASKVEEIGFKDGFIFPVTEHIKTTNFGAQRILNGDPKRPHFGVDLAAPKGTPILAPADGIVSLASEEMYFEGSLIMIDHGQGLISYYLHNEDVMVEEGQRVVQGQQIATVGSRGRSTGPHLCWRLKWRGRNLDPELLTEWPSNG